MTRILVLYYSMYGHIETLANAVADGACSVAGTEVAVKRVPELMPEEVARKAGIEIPTFCYHSELSVYGACRHCLVNRCAKS